MSRRFAIALLLATMAIALWYRDELANDDRSQPLATASTQQAHPGTSFDFYVLALSWSPTFCLTSSAGNNNQQCDTGLRHGFIVHGLWPQYETGYPEFCASDEPQRVPSALGKTVADIMPGMGLVGHQWRKHGSCTGLGQRDYFALVRKARDRIIIPDELENVTRRHNLPISDLETEIIAENPGLTRGAIAVTCDGNRLDEIRICLTKDLDFRDCPEVDRKACPLTNIVIPVLR
ncbi:ribonuclease T2 [Rhizobiaceae bacterium n13]|uniref:Ribonuclease T2 n=1 Tax=Ferirhizobium litorale TaxID=2927786 RepID=A0AAE3U0C8_9HYPH|nr:ribonuclease T2 [Fererhizobium litorale]MDI7861059.1 ribonuclease T2 [Fererhizobium litorale]MDI7921206.1 ribonuclease T2 [Fererhizobium litorale]